jgi:hypothetical protein
MARGAVAELSNEFDTRGGDHPVEIADRGALCIGKLLPRAVFQCGARTLIDIEAGNTCTGKAIDTGTCPRPWCVVASRKA